MRQTEVLSNHMNIVVVRWVKGKGKGTKICIAPHRENLTPEALIELTAVMLNRQSPSGRPVVKGAPTETNLEMINIKLLI